MNNLKLLREKAGLTQSEFAEKHGLSQQAISKYENGTREPDLKTLIMFANYYDVTIDYLLGRNITTISQENNNTFTPISKEHQILISNFDLLNEQGQQFILETMDFALSKPSYKKHNPISQEEIG